MADIIANAKQLLDDATPLVGTGRKTARRRPTILKPGDKAMTNTVNITRRQEVRGFIRIEQSFNDPNRLFISTPNIVELTEEETYNLIKALAEGARNLWGNE